MTKLTKIEQNIQAILFAAGEPYEKERLAKLLEIDRQTLEQLVERINEWYEDTPFILLELDQCYQMATRAEYAQVIRQALRPPKGILFFCVHIALPPMVNFGAWGGIRPRCKS